MQEDINQNTQMKMFGPWRNKMSCPFEVDINEYLNGCSVSLKISIPEDMLKSRLDRAEAIYSVNRMTRMMKENILILTYILKKN